MDIAIRNANQADYESLVPLFRQVHALHVHMRPDLYRENQTPVWKELFEGQLHDAKQHIFVAAIGSEIAGVVVAREEEITENPFVKTRKLLLVDSLCVSKAQRRMGIGKMLMQFVIGFGKSIKADGIELTVLEENSSAISFYESIGMTTKNRKMEIALK